MKVFVDAREPQGVRHEFHVVMEGAGFEPETRELDQADFYLPEYDVAVERKEDSDFASSITEGRLSEQADRMAANHDYNFLVLEGSPYDLEHSDVSCLSLIGMQTSLSVKRGFRLLYTESVSDTVSTVRRLFERFRDEEHESADAGYVKTADTGEVEDVQVAMLMQVEGISEDKARAILDEVGSLELLIDSIISWEREQGFEPEEVIKGIDGVGSVLATRIINTFQ